MSRFEDMRGKAADVIDDPRKRRRIYAVLAVILAVLCVFPQPYVARAKVVPQDASSIGLSSMMGALNAQVQSLASLFGGSRQPVDMYLAIGRGTEVTDRVIKDLKLVGPGGYATLDKARVALDKKVDVHSLTGGIIEVEVRTYNGPEAEALTKAYVQAMSDRIIDLGTDRVGRKREIVMNRFKQAADRVSEAETKLSDFRRRNNLAAPEAELGSAISLRAGLEAQLQAKQVELQTLLQFQGPENPQLRAVQSEVASLRAQIARTSQPAIGVAGPSVAGLSEVSGEYLDLYRDYRFSQALYEVYSRASEEVAVEMLAGDTASDVQIIEAARLDSDRKYNIPAVALLALVILGALFTEIYAPATGIDLRVRRRRASEPEEAQT